MPDAETPTTAEPDYDRLLRANLERVFNERDASKRAAALADLFVDEPVMYEPTDVVRGREAISAVAGKLLEQFGPTFRFNPVGVAVGHHGLGMLRWQAWQRRRSQRRFISARRPSRITTTASKRSSGLGTMHILSGLQ